MTGEEDGVDDENEQEEDVDEDTPAPSLPVCAVGTTAINLDRPPSTPIELPTLDQRFDALTVEYLKSFLTIFLNHDKLFLIPDASPSASLICKTSTRLLERYLGDSKSTLNSCQTTRVELIEARVKAKRWDNASEVWDTYKARTEGYGQQLGRKALDASPTRRTVNEEKLKVFMEQKQEDLAKQARRKDEEESYQPALQFLISKKFLPTSTTKLLKTHLHSFLKVQQDLDHSIRLTGKKEMLFNQVKRIMESGVRVLEGTVCASDTNNAVSTEVIAQNAVE